MNLIAVQQANRILVLSLLRRNKSMSRVDLARASGLKQATITNIVNDLIERRLIREGEASIGGLGRRPTQLMIDDHEMRTLHVRLSRKYIQVGAFDLSLHEIIGSQSPIAAGCRPSDVLSSLLALIRQTTQALKEREGSSRLIGVGVAVPGPFFYQKQKIALMSFFPGWSDIEIIKEIKNATGLPVFIDRDANVCALAEWWSDAAYEGKTLAYINAGQGVGAGIILNGQVFQGALGIAGEIGHMSVNFAGKPCECGRKGCLELYCSTTALLQSVNDRLADYPDSSLKKDARLDDFWLCYEEGDRLAHTLIGEVAEYLAVGIVNVIYAYNPHVIVIGDELARGGQNLLTAVKNAVYRQTLNEISSQVDIRLGQSEKDPAYLGAGILVQNHLAQLL